MNAALPRMYWRVNQSLESGFNTVSLLLPTSREGEAQEFPVELFFKHTSPAAQLSRQQDLVWSEQDNQLFSGLLTQICDAEQGTIEVNLNDEVIQEFIHLVATARFQTPLPAEHLEGKDINTPRFELNLGDIVSLNTCYGFVSAVIIDLDSIDATCILLDEIENAQQELVAEMYSSVVMSRMSVVHEAFSETEEAGAYETVH